MDRDPLFTDMVEPLAWDEALRLAATDRDVLLERLAGHDDRTPLLKVPPHKDRLFTRYRWALVYVHDPADETQNETLGEGRSLTQHDGRKRLQRAYEKHLKRLHDERRKALDAVHTARAES